MYNNNQLTQITKNVQNLYQIAALLTLQNIEFITKYDWLILTHYTNENLKLAYEPNGCMTKYVPWMHVYHYSKKKKPMQS